MTFSHHLPENKITAQMQSGRCWMFAALNTLRVEAIKSMNLDTDFELSQNYLTFWDKFEKANYFLESILKTLDEPTGSRLIDWLLSGPVQDGGQWHMFINLVKKYGVVPKRAMPETESSSRTADLGYHLTFMLRDYACRLRTAHQNGKSAADLRKAKLGYLDEVFRILAVHLGEPPTEFNWQWRDKDKQFHREGKLTPTEFYGKFVNLNLDDFVCLIHDPRPQHSFDQTYTVNFLGNVVGGEPVLYLNVPIDTLKHAAVDQIRDGSPVWFGNDVGKHLDRDLGIMDLELFDYELVYGTKPTMNKAERLQYGHSQMTHAMVFTGVDLDENGNLLKWRVENSWGDKPGEKGFFAMTDAWFDEYMYEVVVHKQFVPAESLKALAKEPVGLDPWDPMGSLA
jgi:bleomycin hydrolase